MSDKITNMDKQASAGAAGKDSTRELFPEGNAMDRFVRVFEASARRWELIIYPFMLAFGVLAASGFFLIYSLSKDISTMAQGMDPQLGKNLGHISESVIYLSENMRTMTRRIYHMSESMETMTNSTAALEYMEPMLANMYGITLSTESMNQNMHTMSLNIDAMRYDMGDMSHSMRPMDRMDSFMPW